MAFYKYKDGKLSSLFLNYILLILSVFVGWNYFGLAFLYYVYAIFKTLDQIGKISFLNYLLRIFILIAILQCGSLFWLTSVDDGYYGLLMNIIYYLFAFIAFYVIKTRFVVSNYSFILFWIIFEYILNTSKFTFPWLTFGNVLSTNTYFIQWYKYTGVLGGTLWLLLLGSLLHEYQRLKHSKVLTALALVFIVPVSISLIDATIDNTHKFIIKEVATVNPALLKVKKVSKDRMAYQIMNLVDTLNPIDILVLPEHTFEAIHYRRFHKTLVNKYMRKMLDKNVNTIFAGSSLIIKNKIYNGGLLIHNGGHQLKLKQKLIPYTEYLPQTISKLVKHRSFNFAEHDSIKSIIARNNIMPLVCYESLFSFYVAKNIIPNSLLVLISSESFLNDSYFGKLQYSNLIKIRSIETGTVLIKASFGGDALVIDESGKILSLGKKDVNYFSVKVKLKDSTTLYANSIARNMPYILASLVLAQIIILFHSNKKTAGEAKPLRQS